MLNSENKTYDQKKILPIILCRFSIDLFALKKCRFAHSELNKQLKKFRYQAFDEYRAD